jgi:hypothetical protein
MLILGLSYKGYSQDKNTQKVGRGTTYKLG